MSRRLRFHVILWLVLLPLALVVGIGAIVMWRPNVFTGRIELALADMFGGDVEVGQVEWVDRWQLGLKQVEVRVAGDDRPAGNVISIDSLTVQWRWSGGLQIDGVTIHDAIVRLIEKAPWELTIAELQPGSSQASDATTSLPSIQIDQLQVQSGVLQDDQVVVVGTGLFTGALIPDPDRSDASVFRLNQVDGEASLHGTLDMDQYSLSAVATGIPLGHQVQQLIPYHWIRNQARTLGLEGEVGEIDVMVGVGGDVEISLLLDALAISLDPASFGGAAGEDFWKIYRHGEIQPEAVPPRLFVESGRLAFAGDALSISGVDGYIASGEVTDDRARIPYHVDFEITDLPDVATMTDMKAVETALSRAPFELDVRAWDVQLAPDQEVVVPAEAARILQLFGVDQCDVQMRMIFARQVEGGSAMVTGDMQITDGEGSYVRFPYPLHDLDADIVLEPQDIVLRSLTAFGAGDSKVSIEGRVEPVDGRDLSVRVFAEDVPLDSTLVAAVPPAAARTLNNVFSGEGISIPAGGDVVHQTVELDLLIEQDASEVLNITGNISFDDLQVTWSRFPLTLALGAGRLRWDDALYLENLQGGPLPIKSVAGGGEGDIAARIEVPGIGAESQSDDHLSFRLDDEQISASLLHALQIITDGQTQPLVDGGLEGVLRVHGDIQLGHEEDHHDINVSLRRGQLKVTPALNAVVGIDLEGPFGGQDRMRVSGDLHLQDEKIAFHPLNVVVSETAIECVGDLSPGSHIKIEAESLQIGPWLVDLLENDVAPSLQSLWKARNPRGQFDVSLEIERGEASGETSTVHSCSLSGFDLTFGEEERTILQRGSLEVTPEAMEFDHLDLLLISPSGRSELSMRGLVDRPKGVGQLVVSSPELDLGLPVVRDVIAVLAGAEAEEWWDAHAPDGMVSIDANIDRRLKETWWSVGIKPRDVELTWRDHRLAFSDRGRTQLTLQPGELLLERLDGLVGEDVVDMTGRVGLDPLSVRLDGTFAGSIHGPLLAACGGAEWIDITNSIELNDGGQTMVDPMRLRLESHDSGWFGRLEAQAQTRGASMTVGLALSDVSASMNADIQFQDNDPLVELEITHADADVAKTRMKSVRGQIVSSPSMATPYRVEIGPLRGTIGSGRLVIDAKAAGPDGDWLASVSVANARLEQLFPEEVDAEDEDDDGPDPSGEVDAAVHLSGRVGVPDSVQGTGDFQIRNGFLRTLPSMVAIQQIMHLSSPVVSAIGFVDVQFLIQGHEAIMSQIRMVSGGSGRGGFSLNGQGTLDLRDMNIDASLRPRGTWPIISDVIGLLQDQFYQVRLTGAVGDPEVRIQTLPGLSGR